MTHGIDSISRSGVATTLRVLDSKPSASQTSSGSMGRWTQAGCHAVFFLQYFYPRHIEREEERVRSESQVITDVAGEIENRGGCKLKSR